MYMKTVFPKSNKGKTFIKNHGTKWGNEFELFTIDTIPKETSSLINSIWNDTARKMTPDMSRVELAELASIASKELYRNLPWYGLSSAQQFDFLFQPTIQKELQFNFYSHYLKKTPFETPHKLSTLIADNKLNCNSQSCIIKESIKDVHWGIHSLYSSDVNKPVNHHTLLSVIGDYVVRIDPTVLPRKELYADAPIDKLYVFPVKDSARKNRYLPTTFLHG